MSKDKYFHIRMSSCVRQSEKIHFLPQNVSAFHLRSSRFKVCMFMFFNYQDQKRFF